MAIACKVNKSRTGRISACRSRVRITWDGAFSPRPPECRLRRHRGGCRRSNAGPGRSPDNLAVSRVGL
jgi:hypothetical protein